MEIKSLQADGPAIDALLESFKKALPEEYQHSLHVQMVTDHILAKLDLPAHKKELISLAALLHDIGKLNLPHDMVTKEKRLSLDEYDQMKEHVTLAKPLLERFSCAENLYMLIHYHHENINGFGYPEGLSGDQIPLGAQIIHIAEAYSSMVYPREYVTPHFNKQTAIVELQEYSGRIYNPDLLKIFIDISTEID